MENEKKELDAEQLDAVSGGATQNRHDPGRCNKGRTIYECVGFLSSCWCDHYTRHSIGRSISVTSGSGYYEEPVFRHHCSMGCFNYDGMRNGDPLR